MAVKLEGIGYHRSPGSSSGMFVPSIPSCDHELKKPQSPKCKLLFEPEYIETYKAAPLPEIQVENNNSRGSRGLLSGSAPDVEISQPRSSPRVQEIETPLKASKTHERQGRAQSQNDQNTRKKEISDLTYFRRVHLLPAEKTRIKKGHWIRKALTQDRSATPFQTLRR